MEETMHDDALCGCSKQMISVSDASYVIHGVPLCSRQCFIRYQQRELLRQHAREELRQREEAARAIA